MQLPSVIGEGLFEIRDFFKVGELLFEIEEWFLKHPSKILKNRSPILKHEKIKQA